MLVFYQKSCCFNYVLFQSVLHENTWIFYSLLREFNFTLNFANLKLCLHNDDDFLKPRWQLASCLTSGMPTISLSLVSHCLTMSRYWFLDRRMDVSEFGPFWCMGFCLFLITLILLFNMYGSVWFLYLVVMMCNRMFDDMGKETARNLYKYSFFEHTLRVTDVVCGHGLCNSIIISSSEDRTCKVRYFKIIAIN